MSVVWLWHHPAADAPADACLGWQDPPLADRDEAKRLALAVAERVGPTATVYTSDFQRARQAARPLARAIGARLEVTRALREVSYGAWEGRLWAEIRRSEPQRYERYMADWAQAAMPGGESFLEVRARVEAWWAPIAKTPGPHVIVAHGGSLRALAAVLFNWTPQEAIAMHLARGHLARIEPGTDLAPNWNVHPDSPFAKGMQARQAPKA